MREADLERLFAEKVVKAGGITCKLFALGRRGVPDRLAVWPGGRTHFLELKVPGETPTPIQEYQIRKLREQGSTVYVLTGKEEIGRYVDQCVKGEL